MFLITKILQDQDYQTIALIYPSLYLVFKKLEVDANDDRTFRTFKENIKNKLSASYYTDGYHTTLPMLASAIDLRFKHLSFLTPSLCADTYRVLQQKIVAWKRDRIQPSPADTVSSPTASISGSAASTSSPDCAGPANRMCGPKMSELMFSLCLTA